MRQYTISVKGSNTDTEKIHYDLYTELTQVMDKYRMRVGEYTSLRLDYKNGDDGSKHKGMFGESFALAKQEFRKWMEDAKKEMDERYP